MIAQDSFSSINKYAIISESHQLLHNPKTKLYHFASLVASNGSFHADDPEERVVQMVMKGNWVKVVEIYVQNPRDSHGPDHQSGDTALHTAVSDGKEEIVKKLIDQINSPQGGGIAALKIENEHGNTPLHLAVSMGTVAMCTWIAKVHPSLVGARNKAGETPFFLAAFHGRKEIFLRLLQSVVTTMVFFIPGGKW
ncbi:hypothetical protein SLA2020_283020 [Shorea laevis]